MMRRVIIRPANDTCLNDSGAAANLSWMDRAVVLTSNKSAGYGLIPNF
jgi:hypothetical protein